MSTQFMSNDKSPEQEIIMRLSDLSLIYPPAKGNKEEIVALKNINTAFKQGEFVALLGPSGCGKTSFLNLLAGYIFPTSGKVYYRDQEVTGPGIERGVVFQKSNLYPWLDCADNVTFGPHLRRLPLSKQKEIAQNYLAMVRLEDFADNYPQELSGGMQQRIALARSLANEPDILLLDEPLGALDALTRIEMQSMIRRIWRESKKTFFLITHDIDEALALAQRILVMTPRPGQIIAEFQISFTDTADLGLSSRVEITPEYISLRDHIFELISKNKKD